ncbi:MAG: ATP-binding protein [Candidatus Magasanikbacteria bacterium]
MKSQVETIIRCKKCEYDFNPQNQNDTTCPMCLDEEIIKIKNLKEQTLHPEKILVAWNLPIKHLNSSFDTYEGGNEIKKFLREAVQDRQDILLCGKTGCGKTHLSAAMLREKIITSTDLFSSHRNINRQYQGCDGSPSYFITVPELLFEIRKTYNDKEISEQEIVDKYSSVELLVLDDLGAEKTSEWVESTLYLIIDRRNRNEKWTIVTSNLTLDEIEVHLGARIASRLSDMKVVNIKLPDYRKKRKALHA